MTFSLQPVGAWEAIPLFHSLVAILGTMTPVLADVLAGDRRKGLAANVSLPTLFDALPGFLERASPAKIRELAEAMLATCTYRTPSLKGRQSEDAHLLSTFDVTMQGRLFTTFKLLAWAVEVNFSDFFAGAKLALAAKQRAASDEAQESATDSTPSGMTQPAAA